MAGWVSHTSRYMNYLRYLNQNSSRQNLRDFNLLKIADNSKASFRDF